MHKFEHIAQYTYNPDSDILIISPMPEILKNFVFIHENINMVGDNFESDCRIVHNVNIGGKKILQDYDPNDTAVNVQVKRMLDQYLKLTFEEYIKYMSGE